MVREADERFDQQGSVGIGIPGMPETADGTLYAANGASRQRPAAAR
ncbi:N-acetyl-D-glucosamine kinase [Klebsiella pneumoniae]|uniref:N-acetyl-D-glucosamine kinase n=1 Tax=Klebsiella pneumoniae TaxID=573 RepID=A0A2X1S9K8_KLEPN|nr:N-acetyl-D-glucosamine kinase [Klebsiella pneumoniae]